jgi:aminoglycoside phosphotransferase
MASSPKVTFTNSLRSQDNAIVPIDQLRSPIDLAPHRLSGNAIWQISESTVLKVGWRVSMNEAEALILLAEKTSVPVPKVRNAYMIGDIGFIVMSKVEGEPLGSCWEKLSHELESIITHQLKSYVLEWRELRSPFLGLVDGGPC